MTQDTSTIDSVREGLLASIYQHRDKPSLASDCRNWATAYGILTDKAREANWKNDLCDENASYRVALQAIARLKGLGKEELAPAVTIAQDALTR